MKAVLIRRHGGPEVLEIADVPEPHPAPGEVAIRLEAIGVNYIDLYHREGWYPLPLPSILGSEGAGTVIEVGEGVTSVSIGDRVAFANHLGAYAAVVVVPADRLVAVPDDMPTDLAAAVLLQGMTVHALVNSCARLEPGARVLVHAAAGGVGSLLVQYLVHRVASTVVATASTAEKRERARHLGAQIVTDYEGFVDAARKLGGVSVAFDGVGRATFDGSLAALAPRGMLVLYGQASGPVSPVDPQILNRQGSVFLTRPSLPHYVATSEELRWRAQAILADVATGLLEVTIAERVPLDEVRRAHEALAGRATVGKIILVP